MKKIFRLIPLLLLACCFECTAEGENVIKNGDFEKWEWAALDQNLGKQLRPLKRKGYDINLDMRGPAYHRWTAHGPTGHLIEGKDAYKGKSVLVNNNTPKAVVIGLHMAYTGILKPKAKYSYEIALKGEGTFIFQAWVQGLQPMTGKKKWLGFPKLIEIEVSKEWKVYKGTLKLPDNKEPDFKTTEKTSCAIIINAGSKIYFDEFKVITHPKS